MGWAAGRGTPIGPPSSEVVRRELRTAGAPASSGSARSTGVGNVNTALSAVFALGAAALFGTSTVLQQVAARREDDVPLVGVKVVRRLLRRPRWLAAVALSGISFGLQALALAFGPLVLVLPISATDLLFALAILASTRHLRIRNADWVASGLVAGGVATFLLVSPHSAGRAEPYLVDWVFVVAGVGGVVGVTLPLALRMNRTGRTALLAGAGGVVFALVDALSKAFVGSIGLHGAGALLRWEPYGLLVAGLTGVILGQGAYRSGSLLVSLPIIDSVEPIGGVLIGATAFGEQIARSPGTLALQLVASLVAIVGIVILGRSPLIAAT
jgi:hypothetical protein